MLVIESEMRLLPEIGTSLRNFAVSPTQAEIGGLFDEIFSDLACSLYLSACALDIPAGMLLRRGLEIGIASLYLWDHPQTFWAWREHDEDLSFKEMLESISSMKYRTFVQRENPAYDGTEIVNATQCNSMYRKFSNVMHGKISSFESMNPDRFTYAEADWKIQLHDTQAVTSIVTNAWSKRHQKISELKGSHE